MNPLKSVPKAHCNLFPDTTRIQKKEMECQMGGGLADFFPECGRGDFSKKETEKQRPDTSQQTLSTYGRLIS